MTGGAAAAQVAEDAALGDAVTASFDTQVLKPKRLSGRYVFTVEQAAQVIGLEAALRRDLGDVIRASMSDAALNGNGVAPNVTGLLQRIAAPNAPAAEAAYADYASAPASAVDGIHAVREGEVSAVLGVATYRLRVGFPNRKRRERSEAMMRRSGGVVASSFMPAASNAHDQAAILHPGADAGRGDSIAAIWPALEVVRDPFTDAGQGRVILTWVALWDLYAAFRSAAYARLTFRLG